MNNLLLHSVERAALKAGRLELGVLGRSNHYAPDTCEKQLISVNAAAPKMQRFVGLAALLASR
jgi:hypothetical protein